MCNIKHKRDVIDKELFDALWKKISVPLGGPTIIAIFRSIIKRASRQYQNLRHLIVAEEGLNFREFEEDVEGISDEDISRSLDLIISELFAFLTQMTGNILVGDLKQIVNKYLNKLPVRKEKACQS